MDQRGSRICRQYRGLNFQAGAGWRMATLTWLAKSARGISEVQLNTGVPVANAILTTEDDDQAIARMHIKGAEAAQVAVEMCNLIRAL